MNVSYFILFKGQRDAGAAHVLVPGVGVGVGVHTYACMFHISYFSSC